MAQRMHLCSLRWSRQEQNQTSPHKQLKTPIVRPSVWPCGAWIHDNWDTNWPHSRVQADLIYLLLPFVIDGRSIDDLW